MTDPALLPVLQKLVPQKDGEPYTVHRTAVVDAVNAGGTVDLNLSGVTVPRVPVLGGAGVWVGDTVSVLAWQGALLVLGAPADGTPPGGAIPTGGFIPFAGTSLPPGGWLWCDGAAVSRTTYADLFAVIGTAYGAGNGSTTFNVPNLGGRVPVGYTSGDSDFNANGKTGGAKTHTLTVSQMPSHNHGMAHTHSMAHTHGSGASGYDFVVSTVKFNVNSTARVFPSSGGNNHFIYANEDGSAAARSATGPSSAANTGGSSAANTSSAGSGQAHNNMQPYVVARYIIKL